MHPSLGLTRFPGRQPPRRDRIVSRRQKHQPRRSHRQGCSLAKARLRRRADFRLNDLPGPGAQALDPRLMPGCPIGRLCIGRRGPPETTRLRNMLGGGDQLGDEISPRQLLVFHRRPTNRRYLRDQRDARRLSVRNDAVICRLLWSIAGHGNSTSRLNCHVSGHCARYDVLLASGMPPLADWFLAGAQRGFRNVYELEPRSAPKQTVFLRSELRAVSQNEATVTSTLAERAA